MIQTLQIENYRLFQSLQIDNLKRINLIAGKNNTGKTALLEVIRLLNNKSGDILKTISEERGDNNNNDFIRTFLGDPIEKMSIASENNRLELDFKDDYYYVKRNDKEEQFSYNRYIVGGKRLIYIPLFSNNKNINSLWSTISLTKGEDEALEIMQILEPKITKLRVDADTPRVLLEDEDTPRPLKNLGDGANRFLVIALSLVNANNSILLIDEFEVGLHYSVQEQLWEVIFEYAQKLNVQVFVTTHSNDTIRAFSNVWNKEGNEKEGQYFRLSRKDDAIKTVYYTAEDLNLAVNHEIETR